MQYTHNVLSCLNFINYAASMPIILAQNHDTHAIYILNAIEYATFITSHASTETIKPIRDYTSTDLSGLHVFDHHTLMTDCWPSANQLIPSPLLQKIAPLLAFEMLEHKTQDCRDNHIHELFIPICLDRKLMITLLSTAEELDCYVSYPNIVHAAKIPSIPACHEPRLNLAMNEFVAPHQYTIHWELTDNGPYQGSHEAKPNPHRLNWLSSADDLYDHIIMPHLTLVETLHHSHLNHGDISDDNVVLSETMQQLFFIDFETLGSVAYVSKKDKRSNPLGFDRWRLAKLYDIVSFTAAIYHLAHDLLPLTVTEHDHVLTYLSEINTRLAAIEEEHFDHATNKKTVLNTALIDRYDDISIKSISREVRRLHDSHHLLTCSNTMFYKPHDATETELQSENRSEKLIT